MRKPNFRPNAGNHSTDQRTTSPSNTDDAVATTSANDSNVTTPASQAAVRRLRLSTPASSTAPANGASASQGSSASTVIR